MNGGHTENKTHGTEVFEMSKKKKSKVRSLTDEQYNRYLMALKDERPTMLIDKDGKRTPQK